jgi:hypothetical protein
MPEWLGVGILVLIVVGFPLGFLGMVHMMGRRSK